MPARWSARSARWSAQKGNQLWQPSCWNCRGVRREKRRIVTTKLLKMWRKKKRKKRELCQPSCRKLGEKFNSNLGNEVAENEGKKEDLDRNLKEKNIVAIDLWQWNCWKGRNKNSSNWFVAMLLPKWKEKKSGNWFVDSYFGFLF